MSTPGPRAVYLTDPPTRPEGQPGAAALLGAAGERLAAGAAALQPLCATAAGAALEGATLARGLARLEQQGLQLQELALVVSRAPQLRQEPVDLGLALLQTVAEWSSEADRLGVDLHGPASSEVVLANPAALKHLLDLMAEHALQVGRSVRLEVDAPAAQAGVSLVVALDCEPVAPPDAPETPALRLLRWLAHALGLPLRHEATAWGERIVLLLPRA